jgi:hypothetical protein
VALHIASSYFDALPHGTATLDNALVMHDVPIQWTTPEMPADTKPGRLATPN